MNLILENTSLTPYLFAYALLAGLLALELVCMALAGVAPLSSLLGVLDGPLETISHFPFFDWFFSKGLPGSLVIYSFLFGFGTTGLGAQLVIGHLANPIASGGLIAASVLGGLLSIKLGGFVFKPLFADKSSSFSEKSLIGMTACVKDDVINSERSGEIEIIDPTGKIFNAYFMAKTKEGESFIKGDLVKVISVKDPVFLVTKNS